MIPRTWRGWTTPANADRYERLLEREIFPGIFSKNAPGFRRIELLRREVDGDVEFMTVMWFDDLKAVRAFAGEDYAKAYVPASARQVLARLD